CLASVCETASAATPQRDVGEWSGRGHAVSGRNPAPWGDASERSRGDVERALPHRCESVRRRNPRGHVDNALSLLMPTSDLAVALAAAFAGAEQRPLWGSTTRTFSRSGHRVMGAALPCRRALPPLRARRA